MQFEQAERRFQELQTQRELGALDEETFRVEVAKLLFRDQRGVFWMLDAGDGTWVCNQGEGWLPCDPRDEYPQEAVQDPHREIVRRRLGRVALVGAALVSLLAVVGIAIVQQWPVAVWNLWVEATPQDGLIQVTIASPADGSQVAVDQEVAIESTLDARPSFQIVDRVELQVNGQTVNSQAVRPKTQPEQTSLPLSQPWLPTSIGEFEVTVVAFSSAGAPLGEAAITLYVLEAPDEVLPERACVLDATFVTDVTIPPGTAFPPGARMDKVWQVRNSGSCAWGVGYELVLLGGESLGAPGAVPVPSTAAGEAADLTITFWAPEQAGSYGSTWQLQSPDSEFFGPRLDFAIQVQILAQESLPPEAPSDLQAIVTEGGDAVRLTWTDQSDNEDAFRIYRDDVAASIGLAPSDAELFVDEEVACGNTYRYAVVAFNAAGISAISETAEAVLPPCATADAPPVITLTVVPTQVVAGDVFTATFRADDDLELTLVRIWAEETGDRVLEAGQVFTCTQTTCTGSWPVAWTGDISTTLTLVALARDSSGQESEPARVMLAVLSRE